MLHLRDLPALEDLRIGWVPITPQGAAELQRQVSSFSLSTRTGNGE
jgi:hypothetical protein